MYLVIKRMSYCAKKRQNQNQIHIFLFLKKIYYTIQSKKKEREKYSIIFGENVQATMTHTASQWRRETFPIFTKIPNGVGQRHESSVSHLHGNHGDLPLSTLHVSHLFHFSIRISFSFSNTTIF